MPSLFNPEIDELVARLVDEWNVAERRIKKAEQVRGNEVVV